jgi:virginiamycin A acetyltransferase
MNWHELKHLFFGGFVARRRDLTNLRTTGQVHCEGVSTNGEITLAEGVRLGPSTQLTDVKAGRYTYFAGQCRFNLVEIGSFCSIARGVSCGMGRHPTREFVSTHPAFYSHTPSTSPGFSPRKDIFHELEPIRIGSDVLISLNAIVLDGITIGDGAIVGAGAVVNRDVQPYEVVGGVPIRRLRMRFKDDDIAFLLNLRWWDRELEWIRAHVGDFENIQMLRQKVLSEEATQRVSSI